MQQLVIIPTYDEEANIKPLIAEISAAVPGIDIVFVDDNSRDQTRSLIRTAIAATEPGRISLIERPRKMGLGDRLYRRFPLGFTERLRCYHRNGCRPEPPSV